MHTAEKLKFFTCFSIEIKIPLVKVFRRRQIQVAQFEGGTRDLVSIQDYVVPF